MVRNKNIKSIKHKPTTNYEFDSILFVVRAGEPENERRFLADPAAEPISEVPFLPDPNGLGLGLAIRDLALVDFVEAM